MSKGIPFRYIYLNSQFKQFGCRGGEQFPESSLPNLHVEDQGRVVWRLQRFPFLFPIEDDLMLATHVHDLIKVIRNISN